MCIQIYTVCIHIVYYMQSIHTVYTYSMCMKSLMSIVHHSVDAVEMWFGKETISKHGLVIEDAIKMHRQKKFMAKNDDE